MQTNRARRRSPPCAPVLLTLVLSFCSVGPWVRCGDRRCEKTVIDMLLILRETKRMRKRRNHWRTRTIEGNPIPWKAIPIRVKLVLSSQGWYRRLPCARQCLLSVLRMCEEVIEMDRHNREGETVRTMCWR
ncbi:hypothetical protein BD410DRAFT_586312 [Rickenella mellea]|uniref:Secreted protein n=1 Tax=Rickenella mellea TaxID=50990 RepID=A0A4Y7PNM8_9AGAM|nr:hypothetical protein BD410DRAFT_586312 [Rickenella mellea]